MYNWPFCLNSVEAIGRLSPEFTEKDLAHYIAFDLLFYDFRQAVRFQATTRRVESVYIFIYKWSDLMNPDFT